ncbi:hypothetical protein [Pedobacter panaciterrae]
MAITPSRTTNVPDYRARPSVGRENGVGVNRRYARPATRVDADGNIIPNRARPSRTNADGTVSTRPGRVPSDGQSTRPSRGEATRPTRTETVRPTRESAPARQPESRPSYSPPARESSGGGRSSSGSSGGGGGGGRSSRSGRG